MRGSVLVLVIALSGCDAVFDSELETEFRRLCSEKAGYEVFSEVSAEGYATAKSIPAKELVDGLYRYIETYNEGGRSYPELMGSSWYRVMLTHFTLSECLDQSSENAIQNIVQGGVCLSFEEVDEPISTYLVSKEVERVLEAEGTWWARERWILRESSLVTNRFTGDIVSQYNIYRLTGPRINTKTCPVETFTLRPYRDVIVWDK